VENYEYFTVREIAEKLGVMPATVRSWCRNNKIKSYKVGRLTRVKKQDYYLFCRQGFDVSLLNKSESE
jgi:excisionase family DNA binding protein